MSSILKALKKLEQENTRRENNASWPQAPTASTPSAQQVQRTWAPANWLILLLCAAMLGMSGWLTLKKSPAPTGPPVDISSGIAGKTTPNAAPADRAAPEQQPTLMTAAERTTISHPEVDTEFTLSAVQISESQVTVPSEQPPTEPLFRQGLTATQVPFLKETQSPSDEETALSAIKPFARDASGQSAFTTRPAPAEEPAKPLPPKASQLSTVQPARRIADSILKLQAVTWAPLAAKRFAVINNRIVREGEGVDGYLVAHIDKDFVTVSKNNQSWEVRFRPR